VSVPIWAREMLITIESEFARQQLVSGRYVHPNPNSPQCYSFIRAWLNNCSEAHADCPGLEGAPLPKRVINVGSREPLQEPYLYESEGEIGTWITLSHRWGGAIGTTLTGNTRAEMLRAIKLTSLPRTFHDTIIVARNLGVSYVWIDALCIVQDSKPDWAQESADMSRIYRSSLFTIAASNAPNSHSGFLSQRSPEIPIILDGSGAFGPLWKDEDPLEICTTIVSPSRNITGTIHIRRPLQPYKFIMEQGVKSHSTNQLQSRGWVLQETILSPRTIHYCKEQMFWQCRTCAFGEGDMENVEFNYWPSYDFQNNKTLLTINLLTGSTCNVEVVMVGFNRLNSTPFKPNGFAWSMNTANAISPTNLISYQLFLDVLRHFSRSQKMYILLARGFQTCHADSYGLSKTVSLPRAIGRRHGVGRHEFGCQKEIGA
jgi:hypothetical protein